MFVVVTEDVDREGMRGNGGGTKEEEGACEGRDESKGKECGNNETFEGETPDEGTEETDTDTDDNEGDTDTRSLPPFAKASPPTTDLIPIRSPATLE
jgi:hypothetical protein